MSLQSVVSLVAIVISVGSFIFTFKTYRVSHRPYVGGFEMNLVFSPNLPGGANPVTGMLWTFVLKNVGSLPAWVKVEEHAAFITSGGVTTSMPVLKLAQSRMLLLPQQTANLQGSIIDSVSGPGTVAGIVSGERVLEVVVRLAYYSSGEWWLWRSNYQYEVRNRFLAKASSPGFTMVSASAD